MACVTVPLTAAVALTAAKKRFSPRYHLGWLLAMLWGGSVWLVVEHLLTGEIVPYPPFFTAGIGQVWSEILMVGVPQLAVTVAAWGVLVAVARRVTKKAFRPNPAALMACGVFLMVLVDHLLA